MHHLASCYQGNIVQSSAPVCVPAVPSTQGFPAENQTIQPMAPMFVYPSPPPSPLYLSPPVSPALSQAVLLTDNHSPHATLRDQRTMGNSESPKKERQKSSVPTNRQLWRPWN